MECPPRSGCWKCDDTLGNFYGDKSGLFSIFEMGPFLNFMRKILPILRPLFFPIPWYKNSLSIPIFGGGSLAKFLWTTSQINCEFFATPLFVWNSQTLGTWSKAKRTFPGSLFGSSDRLRWVMTDLQGQSWQHRNQCWTAFHEKLARIS